MHRARAEGNILQHLYFFFDDSGILHATNRVGYFVYAGFVFTSRDQLDNAKRKYKSLLIKIKKELQCTDELKAAALGKKHRRALYNVLRSERSLSVEVHIPRVYERILCSGKSICRYKDYILKMLVKKEIERIIRSGEISADSDIFIHIAVDEQLTATDGIYGLRASVKEELQSGISNYNYGHLHPPLFNATVEVEVKYCDSKCDYMIQAYDVLANRIYCSYKFDNVSLRDIPNHYSLHQP